MPAMLLVVLAGFATDPQGPAATFPFSGDALEIVVLAQTPLHVQIEDGPEGLVRVEDRTRPPAAAYALVGNLLTITHGSRVPAEYRIEVPMAARVALRVNDATVATLTAVPASRRLVWYSEPSPSHTQVFEAPAPRAVEGQPPWAYAAREFRIDVFRGPLVVDSIDINYPERARIFRIRLGRSHFRVLGDRSVQFGYHKPSRWGVLTVRDTAARVDLELPADARRFVLKVGGRPIWILHSAGARALCQPVSRVTRPDGGEDWGFHLEGGLVCREETEPQPA